MGRKPRKEVGGMIRATKFLAAEAEPALHERVRVRAFQERCSMSEILRRALERYLAQPLRKPRP